MKISLLKLWKLYFQMLIQFVETVDVVKMNPFYYVECDKNFYKSGPYTQHRNVHHTDEKNQIKCNICGIFFFETFSN